MKPSTILAAALLFAALPLGCAHTSEFTGGITAGVVQDVAAWYSWQDMKCFCDRYGTELHMGQSAPFAQRRYLAHFGKGFRAGYRDVARGGTGQLPVLPPREYWSGWYRTPEGHRKTQAWFHGHGYGTAQAKWDGLDEWSHVPVTIAEAGIEYSESSISNDTGATSSDASQSPEDGTGVAAVGQHAASASPPPANVPRTHDMPKPYGRRLISFGNVEPLSRGN